jgi:putative ABC transport system substrate-binding protein
VKVLGNRSAALQFAAIQAMASSVGVELLLLNELNDKPVTEGQIAEFAQSGNGGLIALRLAAVIAHRAIIIKLAAQHRLPAVYPLRIFAADGGLVSYGPDAADQFRQAAFYVDRIRARSRPSFRCRGRLSTI